MSSPPKKIKKDKPDPRGQVYTLETSDGKKIFVREKALKQCQLFDTLLTHSQGEKSIPVHDVNHKALKVVIEFCNNHMDDDEYVSPVNSNGFILTYKDIEIFEKLDSKLFEEVIKAANYVNNARLVDTALMYALRTMNGLEVDEIRKLFRLPDDLEADVKKIFNPEKPECPLTELFSFSHLNSENDTGAKNTNNNS